LKNAYVSVVLSERSKINPADLVRAGKLFQESFQKFEIIYIGRLPQSFTHEVHQFEFPFTNIVTFRNSTKERAILAGIGRSVGDYVLFWDLNLDDLSPRIIKSFSVASDEGAEFVSLRLKQSLASRLVYRILNSAGITSNSYSRLFGSFLSRRLISQILSSTFNGVELDLMLARTNLEKIVVDGHGITPPRENLADRIRRVGRFVARGTRFGTLLPLIIALFSSFLAIAAAVYSLGVYLYEGKTPEGWTTIMMLVGFGQASILLILALIWNQLAELQSNQVKVDVTEEVKVYGTRGNS
jgi:hypothetical protein